MMPCFHHRILISRAANHDRTPPAFTRRHMQHCPTCRQFHETTVRVGQRLRHDADALSADVSEDLHQKILSRCGLDRPATRQPAPRTLTLARATGWALAAAAVALLAVGVWVSVQPAKTPTLEHRLVEDTPKPQPAAKPMPLQIVVELPATSADAAAAKLYKPLEDELARLRQDGKAAADFLLACVPIDMDRAQR
jgi:hypothetical protein